MEFDMLQCYLKSQGFPEVECCVWMSLVSIESFSGTPFILIVNTAFLLNISFVSELIVIVVWLGVDGNRKAETISL